LVQHIAASQDSGTRQASLALSPCEGLERFVMHHLAISAVATALAIGASAGAMTTVGGKDTPPQSQSDMSNPTVAGQAMMSDASILANAERSPEHTAFVSEMKQAGLSNALEGKGEYTVFAPTDQAYAAAGNLGDKKALARDAGYLIVKGRYDSQSLLKAISENGGQVRLRTLEGGSIVASLNGPTNIALMDERGNTADIAIYDIHQSNGVMQIVDRVLEPGDNSRQLAQR
jgi:uncharacterized surface protein with fasciclin (FAS1) repeats